MTLSCTSNREAFAQIRAIFAEGVHLKRLLIFKDLQATNPRLHPPNPAHGPVLLDHSLHTVCLWQLTLLVNAIYLVERL